MARSSIRMRRQPRVARGVERVSGGSRAISVRFDPETFGEILRRAQKLKTSFGEQVRILVEVGIEEMGDD